MAPLSRRLLACAAVCAAQACEAGLHADPRAACDERAEGSQALYAASAEPTLVALDAGARNALVAVFGQQGPERGLCTGVLIAPRFVLTAAHCSALPAVRVAFGSDAASPRLVLSVRRAIPHPRFDALLLELAAPELSLELGAEPIRTAGSTADEPLPQQRAQLAGFGLTEELTAGELLFADEPVVAVDETTIEVDGAREGGACLGDSGGPLLVAQAGAPLVAGVLRAGAADCLGVDSYTRLSVLAPWIETTLAQAAPVRAPLDACP